MKKITLIIAVLFLNSINAQLQDTLYLNRLNDAKWVSEIKHATKFKTIKFHDGTSLNIGDKMRYGYPSSGNASNITSSGMFSTNTTSVNNYSYMMLGRMGMALMAGITFLPESFKGTDATIEEIKFIKKNKKAKEGGVLVFFDNQGADVTVLNIDLALQFGELINPNAKLTSDQALAELQKAKSKLDLEVITQEEYDAIKKELMNYIK